MKKTLKSSLSVFLAIVIIFSSVYVGLSEVDFGALLFKAYAAESSLTFTLNNDGASYSVTSCDTSASGELIIPDTYKGLPVTGIGEGAFLECSGLTRVTVPDTVTNIGIGAFAYCENITSITISEGIKVLDYAFLGCASLEECIIPDSVESIVSAFAECISLTAIVIPDSVTDITGAFMNCTDLTSVVIPANVKNTEDAFIDCKGLTSVVISEGVKEIGAYTFDKCTNLTEVTIPVSVTCIGDSAFGASYEQVNVFFAGSQTQWESITKGKNNESIVDGAIHYFSTDHQFSDSWTVDVLPTYSTEGSKSRHCVYCDEKTDVAVIPRIKINDIMYMETTGLDCDGEITYVLKLKAGEIVSGSVFNAVYDPAVLEVVEEKSGACTTVDDSGNERENFSGFYITGMKHGTTDTFVVAHMNFNDLVYNRDKEYIKFTFKVKDFSKTETAVDFYCQEFVGDSETTSKNCNVLVSHFDVTITKGTGHKYSWKYNYENNTKTKTCSVCGDEITEKLLISDILTFTLNSNGTSYSVTDCVNEYPGAIEIPEAYSSLPVTAIGAEAFRDCEKITSVVIPDSVISIGGSAFRNCTKLTNLDLSANITNVPGAMCFGCTKLENVSIPDGVVSIGGYAFSGCTSLEFAVLPDSATNIGGSVFDNCKVLIINCNKNSVAQSYAGTNGISYIVNTPNTCFDVCSGKLYTTVLGGKLDSIVFADDSLSCTMNKSYAGTGAVIEIVKDGAVHSQFTVVVEGDTNGDSVCDVLDCSDVERVSNGNAELSGVFAEAGDVNDDGVIDIADYQATVNKALA